MELFIMDEEEPCLTVLPKEQYLVILLLSSFLLFTSLYAGFKRKYDLSIIMLLIFFTSVNYWRLPCRYGFNRTVDMIVVITSIFYIILRTLILNIKLPIVWFSISFFLLCYPASLLASYYGYMWGSALLHCLFHLLGNFVIIKCCTL